MLIARSVFAILCALLTGCGHIAYKPMPVSHMGNAPKKIAIFFDGTHNDPTSDTNVKKLHSLVTLQDREDIATIYIDGVGVGDDILGMGLGFGAKARVRIAYEFILANYRDRDQIYIFGFSRGAFQARILASMLAHVGVARYPQLTYAENSELLFDAYKGVPNSTLSRSVKALKEIKEAAEKKFKDRELQVKDLSPVSVEVLGLWETVAALGFPDYGSRISHRLGIEPHFVDIDEMNKRYGDQLCNVKSAYQALSIDDDREWIFTPLPITRRHLFEECSGPLQKIEGTLGSFSTSTIPPGRLQEVWFSGAHSDIGGGYNNSRLSGVTLNWMIRVINEGGANLLPATAKVPQDQYGSSHDPDAIIYRENTRNIAAYVMDEPASAPGPRKEFANSMCVHPDVFARRRTVPLKAHENHQLTLFQPGSVCVGIGTGKESNFANPKRWEEVLGDANNCPVNTKPIHVEQYPNCQGIRDEQKSKP